MIFLLALAVYLFFTINQKFDDLTYEEDSDDDVFSINSDAGIDFPNSVWVKKKVARMPKIKIKI